MPRITIPLAVNYDNITRPVALSIARDVMTLCDIDSNTPIYLSGEFEQLNQPGTVMGQTDEVRFESNQRLLVTADDTTRYESIMNQVVRSNELPPLLEDRNLGISIRPVFVQSDLVLTFRYITATRQQAIKWRDEIAIRRAEERTAVNHEIRYDIPIQDGVLGLLSHLHSLREKVAGYGDTFKEYFELIQKRLFSSVGTRDGDIEKLLLIAPEKQAPVTGYFDFSDIPKESKVDTNSTWEINFTYRVSYQRCTHLYIVYPLMIHQQHISRKFFSANPRFSVEELVKNGAIGIRALDLMDGMVESLPLLPDGLRFPFYDEWLPGHKHQPAFTTPAISWMISVDPINPRMLMSLLDIPEVRFSPEIEVYLKLVHDRLHRKGGSAILLTLYADDLPMDQSALTIDQDLNVKATIDLDLRKSYHVRLSFPTYYPLFSNQALTEMRQHPIAILQVFQSILPRLDVEWAMDRLVGGKYLPKQYIQWFYGYLQNHGIGFSSVDAGLASPVLGYIPGENGWKDPGHTSGSNWNNPRDDAAGVISNRPADLRSGGKYVQFLSIVSVRPTGE